MSKTTWDSILEGLFPRTTSEHWHTNYFDREPLRSGLVNQCTSLLELL